MPHYLTCEADLNSPVPNVERLLAKLRTLSHGQQPVTAKAIATAVGGDVLAVEDVLRRASHSGLVRLVPGKGWVPTSN